MCKIRYSDGEIDAYLTEAVDFVHKKGGAICATHPYVDYWKKYNFDAVDREPMTPLSNTDIEKYWIDGGRIAVMNSVDLFGVRRMLDNPAVNFVYLSDEPPSRDSVVSAIKAGRTIAAAGFDEADITLCGRFPGDEISLAEAEKGSVRVSAKIMRGNIEKLRVYSGADVIYSQSDIGKTEIDFEISLKDLPLKNFVRVEIEGQNLHWICNSTPFYIKQ